MTSARIALATCSSLPDLEPDDAPLIPALAARGVTADVVVWDAPDVDWSVYDAVVIRSTWDYTDRPAEFLDWTRRVEAVSRLFNPASVVAWNVDKAYQRQMQDAGLPIVPTIWLDPESNFNSRRIHSRFPAFGDFVIKPTISAGSRDTGRYAAGETPSRMLAIAHARDLLGAGRHVMIQRYLRQVDSAGESALVFFDGKFSHSLRKAALLDGPFRSTDNAVLYHEEVMTAREASPAELEVAQRVVAALPELAPGIDGPLLYTRVDLIPDDEGNPVVLEVEVIEPSFFFALAPEAVDRFADALVARL